MTGISTGSLQAPFAFLGPAYDHVLKEAYTTVSDKDIYKAHKPLAILLSLVNIKPLPSLAENKPMEELVARLVDDKLLAEIAQEHRKGRRLLIGTTQMDAQRLVIWNMGAIANSGSPQALALFRKIMVASASIPAFFPPILRGGGRGQEIPGDARGRRGHDRSNALRKRHQALFHSRTA